MNRIRQLRKEKKLSGKQLGAILGYAESTIHQWERGTRFPDVPSITQLASFFNVSIDYLLGRTDYDDVLQSIKSYQNSLIISINMLPNYPKSLDDINIINNKSTISIPIIAKQKLHDLFAITCESDEMLPTIKKGDIIIMSKVIDKSENSIVLFNLDNITKLARYHEINNDIILYFDQAGIHPILVKNPKALKLLAQVIEIRRKF